MTRTTTLVLFAIVILMAQSHAVKAQWTTGTNISNTNSGNVGIGTANPQWGKLQVNKLIRIDDDSGSTTGSDTLIAAPALYLGTTSAGGVFQFNGSAGIDLWQHNNGAWGRTFTFTKGGNLGIGTASPQAALDVNGSLIVRGNSTLSNAASVGPVYNAGYYTTGGYAYSQGYNYTTNQYIQLNMDGSKTVINAFSGGNVGIGTTSPLQKLQLGGNTTTSTATPDAISLGGTYSSTSGANPKLRLFDNNAGDVYGLGVSDNQFDFMIPTSARYVWNVNGVEKMRLDNSGNVTISGSIAAKYQDVAEWVESSQVLAPGTVVVLDQSKSNQVVASSKAYDTRVAGVISTQPGLALGEKGASKVLVATTGRVRIKVDASSGPIQIGDLLVTSDIPGVAKKSEPLSLGGVEIHRPGTLIGKALEPLAKGTGEILTLLSLQ